MAEQLEQVYTILNQERNIKISDPDVLKRDRFPRSSKYDPHFVLDKQMGPNAMWLIEWLSEKIRLRPGMRVLDMGCGKALSSVFLAKEFGVQVWANDWWIDSTDNWKTICSAGLEDRIFPIRAEAHQLPYAEDFFDAIVSMDSYNYYGTDETYMVGFHRFLKKGGQIGIVVPGVQHELSLPLPEHLTRPRKDESVFWQEECWTFHSPEWWRNLWDRHSFLEVETADSMPDGCALWLDWERVKIEAGANFFPSDVETLEADGGSTIGFTRMVARRI